MNNELINKLLLAGYLFPCENAVDFEACPLISLN